MSLNIKTLSCTELIHDIYGRVWFNIQLVLFLKEFHGRVCIACLQAAARWAFFFVQVREIGRYCQLNVNTHTHT